VSQPKVFEFAKEIGMETLALMDKIREWKLPVRSHMAELDADMLEQIKAHLSGETTKAAEPAKKKVAKKPATPKAAKATKAAASTAIEKPANKTAKKTATKKAAEEEPAKTAAAKKPAAGVVVKKAAAKVVVRRKSDEEEAQAAEAAAAAAASPSAELEDTDSHDEAVAHDTAPAATESPAVETLKTAAKTVIETLKAAAQAVVDEIPALKAETPAPAPEKQAEAAAPAPEKKPETVAKAPAKVADAPRAAATAPAAATSPEAVAAAPTPAPVATPVAPVAPARKREVVMTSQGPISGVRSEAPRRNIVGRMDLSRVQAPQGGGPSGPGGGPGGGGYSRPTFGGGPSDGSRPTPIGAGGPGPRGMGPRPLRPGFVASAPAEPPSPDDVRRNFDDSRSKFRAKGPGPGGPGSTVNAKEKTQEEELQSFSSTEFRKREMVFQPKKKKSGLARTGNKTEITTPKASKRIVKIDQKMKLSDLANEIGVKAAILVKTLMKQGFSATMNTDLDFDTIALILPDLGFEAVNVHKTVDEMLDSTAFGELSAELVERPPVVTIMGHVDHGKTSLLDSIRKARVAAGEAGGITQHIGAYQVTTESGHLVTFIDTPGHEAFTAMRARGANATDIAIIVVAADDGVMPQTIEAVNHAKAAGVPIIVALNKMDKAGANPDRVMQQLTEQQLVPEQWGGDTIYCPVSAHTKEGIPALLEQIYTVAEVEELRANPKRSATGLVIESRMDKGRGPVATLLIQDGTLEVGQTVVVGSVPGRVRSLINDKGQRVKSAGPSVPVEIQGLSEVPLAGDRFDVTPDEKTAESIAATRRLRAQEEAKGTGKVSLEDIFSKLKNADLKELAIVLKSDMAGSAEAIKGMFEKIGNTEVKPKIIHSAVGGINESDVLLASTAKGIVVGFNVRPDSGAQTASKRLGVDVKVYTIVYELMDDMKKALAGMLTPDIVEKELGRAEVRNIFSVPKIGTIAGSFVTEGKINRNNEVRLVRDGKIIYTGKLGSLKRFKDDAKEVATGYECGIGIDGYNDLKIGDVIEAFTKETVVRELQ
jgi:translation initiation factor IF-2